MLIFEAACPIFYDVVFTPSQHEKPCAIKKASSFNAFKRRLCLHGCSICGYVYDPELGDPDNGVAPGTPWEEVPEDWVCPLCSVGKDQFSPEE